MKSPRQAPRAFTLIEVLVVVAIIALLLAILLPSLQRAREQAKIGVCKASLQQIGLSISTYQAAEAGFVPVLLNYYSNYMQTWPDGTTKQSPARSRWGSVALRRYDRVNSTLPPGFDANEPWDNDRHKQYEEKLMPRHWSCPFVREKGDGWIHIGAQLVTGPGPAQNYQLWEWNGRHESYHPWLWEDVVRNKRVRGATEIHPNDPIDGRPKYSVITFNRIQLPPSATEPQVPGAIMVSDVRILFANRRWSAGDARRRYSASLSDMSMMYCAQGNFLAFEHAINNPESHRTSQGAGTNTVFVDGHVDWVRGTRIGWP